MTPQESAIRESLIDGSLPCSHAFRLAETLDRPPRAIGEETNRLELRVSRCQLGIFGYKDFGDKRLIRRLADVPADVAQALTAAVVDDVLPCASAWKIGRDHSLPRLVVGCAAESLEIRIGNCQLNCF